jgi:hypothetical protein
MAVPFDRFDHAVRVTVQIGGDNYRFLVDSGIGVTVVSSAVAARDDVRKTGESMTGRRMSGQAIRAPLVRLPKMARAREVPLCNRAEAWRAQLRPSTIPAALSAAPTEPRNG